MLRYYRKVIQIKATDSPNVQLGLIQLQIGFTPTDEIIVPGVLTYGLFAKRRKLWDKIRQTIGLDAEFYEGAELLLYPPDWLDLAEQYAELVAERIANGEIERKAKSIGVDVAQGGDSTSMFAVDNYGIMEGRTTLTPDTSVIPDEILAFTFKHGADPSNVWMDGGGGGKQHADYLARKKHKVNLVYFGESVTPKPKQGRTGVPTKVKEKDERYTYVNRRAQIFHILHLLINPARPLENEGFAIPAEYTRLREELSPIPLLYDREQRIRMLPKNKAKEEEEGGAGSKEKTLTQLIGWSPDEADALCLATYGLTRKPKPKIGAVK